MSKTLVLAASDIAKIVLDVGLDEMMDDLISSLESAFAAASSRPIETPVRAGFEFAGPNPGLLEWMPVSDGAGTASLKMVGYNPSNPSAHGIPTIVSTVSSYDTTTGHLVGLADATFITALRTGAVSAVASSMLAPKTSKTIGLIGCGAQAVSQLHGLLRVFAIGRVVITDTDQGAERSFPARVEGIGGPELEISNVPIEEVVAEADILCTSTSVPVGSGPLFEGLDHKPWLHVNAVGSDFAGKFELPESMLRRAVVCTDFPDQALREGESQRLTRDELGPSLTELVSAPESWEGLRDRLTVFDSTGWALADHVAFRRIRAHAERMGLGTMFELETSAGDPLDPYQWSRDNEPASGPEDR